MLLLQTIGLAGLLLRVLPVIRDQHTAPTSTTVTGDTNPRLLLIIGASMLTLLATLKYWIIMITKIMILSESTYKYCDNFSHSNVHKLIMLIILTVIHELAPEQLYFALSLSS